MEQYPSRASILRTYLIFSQTVAPAEPVGVSAATVDWKNRVPGQDWATPKGFDDGATTKDDARPGKSSTSKDAADDKPTRRVGNAKTRIFLLCVINMMVVKNWSRNGAPSQNMKTSQKSIDGGVSYLMMMMMMVGWLAVGGWPTRLMMMMWLGEETEKCVVEVRTRKCTVDV